jgi:hypothetical protein
MKIKMGVWVSNMNVDANANVLCGQPCVRLVASTLQGSCGNYTLIGLR